MQTITKTKTLVVALALSLISIGSAMAAEPLVDVEWVKENTGKDGIVMVDLRGKSDYLRGHVPGAVHTDYGKDGWREERGDIPGLMPKNTDKLAKTIGALGIDNDTHVVLMPPGGSSHDMGIGTRVYWTFMALGHDDVSILNGGMNAYLADTDKKGNPTNPLDRGNVEPEAETFTVNLREDMIPDADAVEAMASNGAVLIDNRTADQYLGVNQHPKSKAKGTIPDAKNVPQSWLTENGGGKFRDPEQIAALYEVADVPTEGEQVTFCNTGHWASIGWFASHELLGNKDAKMYDGSVTDWTAKKKPMDAEITVTQ